METAEASKNLRMALLRMDIGDEIVVCVEKKEVALRKVVRVQEVKKS